MRNSNLSGIKKVAETDDSTVSFQGYDYLYLIAAFTTASSLIDYEKTQCRISFLTIDGGGYYRIYDIVNEAHDAQNPQNNEKVKISVSGNTVKITASLAFHSIRVYLIA